MTAFVRTNGKRRFMPGSGSNEITRGRLRHFGKSARGVLTMNSLEVVKRDAF
jgi:hypothetical protein